MAPLNVEDLADDAAQGNLRINGDVVTVTDGADVREVLRTETRRRGITTFVATVNGRELNSVDEIDTALDNGDDVDVRTYAKPGSTMLSL